MPRSVTPAGRAEPGEATRPSGRFVTTHWSAVLNAGRCDSPEAQDALARLCQAYWFPLYAFARQKGSSPHNAQDLTQEFFARLLRQKTLAQADPFAVWLLAVLTRPHVKRAFELNARLASRAASS